MGVNVIIKSILKFVAVVVYFKHNKFNIGYNYMSNTQ